MGVLNEKAESVKDDATDATSLLFTSTGKLNDQGNYYDDEWHSTEMIGEQYFNFLLLFQSLAPFFVETDS